MRTLKFFAVFLLLSVSVFCQSKKAEVVRTKSNKGNIGFFNSVYRQRRCFNPRRRKTNSD